MFEGSEYLDVYERDFERIREFDTIEDAKKALAARDKVESDQAEIERASKKAKNLRVGKIRGDIQKGSVEDEEVRSKIRAELMAEIALEKEADAAAGKGTSKAVVGPKTTKRGAK